MRIAPLLLLQALSAVVRSDATDYLDQAIELMEDSPLIDTHIDLPQIIRSLHRNPLSAIPLLNNTFPGHIDIPRLRTGRLGGAFWTVWAPCPDVSGGDPGPDFLAPTHHVRDALEMVDIIEAMVAQHPEHFAMARTSADIWRAFRAGKVASLLGMEGTHLLGNSLGVLRVFATLGVRYLTLTHTCHSAFASAARWRMGEEDGEQKTGPMHEGNGLSELGVELVRELNRVGILVDLSHTSDETMRMAIEVSEAPVVWTHAGARGVREHVRNVPDEILGLIGDEKEGKTDGVVQSVFFPQFIGEGPGVNVSHVVDHMEYLARRIGRNRVGIASDFDGMFETVDGLEDATKYPNIVAELLFRGWSPDEVRGAMGGNLMRIMDKADEVRERLKHRLPSPAIWEKRTDLPSTEWGGGGVQVYWPPDVKETVDNMVIHHDEL